MPLKRGKSLELIMRRQRVAELHLQGWSQQCIANEVGTVQSVVFNDLKQIRKEWREAAIRDFDAMRDEELRRLERIEKEAWSAWERSQKPQQSARVSDKEGGKGHKTVKAQVGNPRFIEVVLKCIESRRAMLGLDAPTKIAPTTPDGGPLSLEERQGMVNAILVQKFGMAGLAEEIIDDARTSAAGLVIPVGRGTEATQPAQLRLEGERMPEETPSAPGGVPEADL
jgi:hypothetical protein